MKELNYTGIPQVDGTKCHNLVLMCMDFRFHRRLIDILGFAGYHEIDILALPGSSKALIETMSREVVFMAIETAIAAHGIKRFVILNHVDCKAYGGSELFPNAAEEAAHHEKALNEAAAIVSARFPGLEVVKLYAAWDYVYCVE